MYDDNTKNAVGYMSRNHHLIGEELFKASVIRLYGLYDFQYDELAEIVNKTWETTKIKAETA